MQLPPQHVGSHEILPHLPMSRQLGVIAFITLSFSGVCICPPQ